MGRGTEIVFPASEGSGSRHWGRTGSGWQRSRHSVCPGDAEEGRWGGVPHQHKEERSRQRRMLLLICSVTVVILTESVFILSGHLDYEQSPAFHPDEQEGFIYQETGWPLAAKNKKRCGPFIIHPSHHPQASLDAVIFLLVTMSAAWAPPNTGLCLPSSLLPAREKMTPTAVRPASEEGTVMF